MKNFAQTSPSVLSRFTETRRTIEFDNKIDQRPRQFYINTGHVRQRQAIFNNCEDQVETLYGVNTAPWNPMSTIKQSQTYISVPAIHNITAKSCNLAKTCKPPCMPPCPRSGPGKPMTMKYYRSRCCKQEMDEKAAVANMKIDQMRELYEMERPSEEDY